MTDTVWKQAELSRPLVGSSKINMFGLLCGLGGNGEKWVKIAMVAMELNLLGYHFDTDRNAFFLTARTISGSCIGTNIQA